MIDILHEILALREERENEERRVYRVEDENDLEFVKGRLKRELDEDEERKRLKYDDEWLNGGC